MGSALSLQITPPHPTLYEPFTSRTANVIRSASRPASIRRLSSAGSRLWPGLPSTGSTTTWRLPSTPRRLRWPSEQFGGPPGGFGGPPGQYPPPPQHAGYGPPQGGFPPQQQQWGPPPAMPSPGYDPRAQAQGDASRDADALRAAMKGFGTDENALIRILAKPDPLQMALLKNTYNQRHRRDLEKDIRSETSKYFREGLVALVQGPLMHDVHSVHEAIKGLGTKESVLNDVLLGRSNADMRAIKQAYQETYRRALETDVKGDLSMKTERLFSMVMAATRSEESAPVIPHELERDVTELHRAMDARVGTDQVTVCSILSQRSDGQIRALAHHWQQKYHNGLEKVIESEFSGHM